MADAALWYKNDIFYELYGAAFGTALATVGRPERRHTDKLDYVRYSVWTRSGCCQSLPPRCRDDGYDVSDYCYFHPMFGKCRSFRELVKEAHQCVSLKIWSKWCKPHFDQHLVPARASPTPG